MDQLKVPCLPHSLDEMTYEVLCLNKQTSNVLALDRCRTPFLYFFVAFFFDDVLDVFM